MKSRLTFSKNLLLPVLSVIALFASVCVAQAQILLDVQVSSGTVTITATGTDSAVAVPTSDGYTFGDGIDLLNFFQQDVTGGPQGAAAIGDSLTTGDGSGSTGVYNAFAADGYTADNVYDYDLNIYSEVGGPGIPVGATGTETFSTGSPAFTGTITFDMGSLSGALPTGTLSGNIIAGYSGTGNSNPVIGQWQVINNSVSAPEPASWVLLGTAVLVLALFRSRRRQAARIDRR